MRGSTVHCEPTNLLAALQLKIVRVFSLVANGTPTSTLTKLKWVTVGMKERNDHGTVFRFVSTTPCLTESRKVATLAILHWY